MRPMPKPTINQLHRNPVMPVHADKMAGVIVSRCMKHVRLVGTGPARIKRHEASWADPVERDVLARIRRPNLNPNASTEQVVDLPQVTSCPGPVSEPGAFMSCGYVPGGLVGPVKALAQAFTLPAISVAHWARSDAISKVIPALSTPPSCLPSAVRAATPAR